MKRTGGREYPGPNCETCHGDGEIDDVTCDYCRNPGHTRRDCGKPSDAECAEIVAALAKVLPPALVPPVSAVAEWVGASRVAVLRWAEAELEARTNGGTVTKPPRDISDWIRWGTSDYDEKLRNVLACAERFPHSKGDAVRDSHRDLGDAVNKTRSGS